MGKRTARLLLHFLIAVLGATVGLGIVASAWTGPADPPVTRGAARDMHFRSPSLQSRLSTIVEPALARRLAESSPDDVLPAIVVLDVQTRLERLVNADASPQDARARVVARLQDVAEASQKGLRVLLAQGIAAGAVESFTSYWIFNGIAVRAQPDFIWYLASEPGVASVRLDKYRRWLAPDMGSADASDQKDVRGHQVSSARPEWNVVRIRADDVWSSLGVSGTGSVIAGMDTGVDGTHPELASNYRGRTGDGFDHTASWFDAVAGSTAPYDNHGHGTHTLGTAVGRGGIGVAPGARWIGVKVLDGDGYGYDSWIHSGFEWLLAPGGDPAQSPDVVNCSWGSGLSELTVFQPALRALEAAGIVAVFSAGNQGPGEATIASPASLPEALAVGAVDELDEVATFSSRGPSPWGEVRPHLVAPGAYIRSSVPGGGHATWKGTSMAAPHVAGIVGLLRSVDPSVGLTEAARLMTATARPLGESSPNNDAGWGRVDAFAAVSSLVRPGAIAGQVRRRTDGAAIVGASVVASATSRSGHARSTTDEAGRYQILTAPGSYDVSVSAFGYVSQTWSAVAITHGLVATRDFALGALPTGLLRVRLRDGQTSRPITGELRVLGSPLSAVGSDASFRLPTGVYTVRASSRGHRVVTGTARLAPGLMIGLDLETIPAPRVLLVDSGAWLYQSEIGYFRQALDDLGYVYDQWEIRHLADDVPRGSDLTAYDVVIWSAPYDAPGYVGAEHALVEYLDGGGRLFLTGQDIGYFDGGVWDSLPYYRDYLKARFVRDNANAWTVHGAENELLSGFTMSISGSVGAANQATPDEIDVSDPSSAAPILQYGREETAAVRVGTCLGYRVVYFGFGFEAIVGRGERRAVMGRVLDWFGARPPNAGIALLPTASRAIGKAGSTVTHAIQVRHTGQAGGPDLLQFSVPDATWETTVTPDRVVLTPCGYTTAVVSVTIPSTCTWDAHETSTLLVQSTVSATAVGRAQLATKTPAPVLLVDDDRFFEQQPLYEAMMQSADVRYDTWQTCPAVGSCRDRSPPLDILRQYPIVVWWTGYDWYQPLTMAEADSLLQYLGAGGRLLLSSQDYLGFHGRNARMADVLGVLTYTLDVTATQARGVSTWPLGAPLASHPLTYPYPARPDAIVPARGSAVVFRDQLGRAVGIANRPAGTAAVLLTIPLEALPAEGQTGAARVLVGWLSWLGNSRLAASHASARPGDTVRYSLDLRNDGPEAVTVRVSNTLPALIELVHGSLSGPGSYASAARRVEWLGDIGPDQHVQLGYSVLLAYGGEAGEIVSNRADLTLVDQQIHVQRHAEFRIDAADLGSSDFCAALGDWRAGAEVQSCFVLRNRGVAAALPARLAISIPLGATLVPGSLRAPGVGTTEPMTSGFIWVGPLGERDTVTLTYRLALQPEALGMPVHAIAELSDERGGEWERLAWYDVEPFRSYLPLIVRTE